MAAAPDIRLPDQDDLRIGVLGLGYVGLPLAVALGRELTVIGFDVDAARIDELCAGRDPSREVPDSAIAEARRLTFTNQPDDLAACNVYIVAVPTPVDEHKRPDTRALEQASTAIGGVLARGDVVIFEATVYPGCTEEHCLPILEQTSGLALYRDGHGGDFHLGYSPERINPGDSLHSLQNVVKITSGSSPAAAEFVDALYRRIVTAGTHRAASIRVAEAAKVIENTQRDLNIALVNELALIFNRLGIDTRQVLEAAGTKWNFLPFQPGLVGGHCIGVDPYYLTSKAESVGYYPEVILAGRRINDTMGRYVAGQVVKLLAQTGQPLKGTRCLVLGLTFKENCADLRNTRVVDIINELAGYCIEIDVNDPWVQPDEAAEITPAGWVEAPQAGHYDAIILAVAHRQFIDLGTATIKAWGTPDAVIYDVKGVLDPREITARL
ncbi:MAG: nucleotide sugar dehydrogenase [Wenzhouxiangellaceae bacterium]|nr:nucleotide sugar dehydrogenase [Wenzhouxiangellaceae bacterium]